ncbi:MAG: hypothetical protein E7468_03555 [Ruminococcaceae bacterium]|nr:hypothetical protein [Oscillospiraceae bacterium]
MKLNFRIDWGYQYLYSRRHYHPQYIWDGSLQCENGVIEKAWQLDYPVIWYGPGHCAKETQLPEPCWESRTKRGVAGVRFEAEVSEQTVFHLQTGSACVSFRAEDLHREGRLSFPVGPKYLGCFVTVTVTGHLWFRNPLKPGEKAYEADSLGLPVHPWARMELAWLEPGETVTWEEEIDPEDADVMQQLIHLVAMAVPAYSPETETQVTAEIPMEITVDGVTVASIRRFYRHHDFYMQMLEDEWVYAPVTPGRHVLGLKNCHGEVCLGISRIVTKTCGFYHGQLDLPAWCLENEQVWGKVFSVREGIQEIICPVGVIQVDCVPGWNEFPVKGLEAGSAAFSCGSHQGIIEVINSQEEEIPVKVGYDMTVVPHDDNGHMDRLLDYTAHTRLGNYVMFRSFGDAVEDALPERWGKYCRDHGLYVGAANLRALGNTGALAKAAGEYFNDYGAHEFTGIVYAWDPTPVRQSEDMKEASEKFLQRLRKEIDASRKIAPCIAFGDASGGTRYAFMAGMDFVRAETMVGHTQMLLSKVRPAAEALGKGRWGVHIAIQHHYQPYQKTHLGQYFLSLMQPWIMGAELIYEEDSLFELFKEERQAWDDYLTKGKRDMTRDFYRFVKTHPRKGKCVRSIAFLEGRYAAPFNGFICGSEQDPHYSVWGGFGNPDPSWGHRQPEKCWQLLDVLMPGASTHPLRQKFEKRRFFFSGTPFGDFDCVPVEAAEAYLQQYSLLMNLGWNTCLEQDVQKLRAYVEAGGVLLTGIPQFSTHVRRDFLEDMQELSLYNDGDLRSLCGIRVLGRGERYSGQWNCRDRERKQEAVLSAMPSDDVQEDGAACLAEVSLEGAQIVAWDSFTGKPMLVRYPLGKGWVYTFTLWAYPGHEQFQTFCATWIKELAGSSLPCHYIEDPSGEVFWTRWVDADRESIMLLNTDWTEPGNEKEVVLVTPDRRMPVIVREGTLTAVTVEDGKTCVHVLTL